MESLMKAVADMSLMFNNRMAEFESREQMNKDTSTSTTLQEDFTSFKKLVLQALSDLQNQVQMLAHITDNMETRSRRNMLLIHGVSEDKNENTTLLATKIITEDLKISNFTVTDVKRSHRMGRIASSSKPRPIIIKFNQTTARDSVWFAKTKLKGTGVTVSEFLTKSRHNVFMSARERFGVDKCWTRDGNIFVMGPGDKRHRVTSLMELGAICVDTVKPAAVTKTTVAKTRRAVKKIGL